MSLRLSELVLRAIEQTLEDRIAVAFSGGLDSTAIATVARKHSTVDLFTAGVQGCEDLVYAEQAAAALQLPLHKLLFNEQNLIDTYAQCHSVLQLDFLKLEILVPVCKVAEAAANAGHAVMLFGSGAEELFVGYERYFLYKEEGKDLDRILKEEYRTLPQRDIGWVKKICRKFGVEARFPFYDDDLAKFMFSVPLEERMNERELKKGLLRDAAKLLGVPDQIVARKKKAMQYGSGIHKALLRHADEINRDYPPAKPC